MFKFPFKFSHQILILTLYWGGFSPLAKAQQEDLYQLYQRLREAAHTHEPYQVRVANTTTDVNDGLITFGAEKEGSSARLTRVAGPTAQHFLNVVDELENTQSEEKFLRHFLSELGANHIPSVERLDGTVVHAPFPYSASEINQMSFDQMDDIFRTWLAQTDESPYSMMKLNLRRKLFYGQLDGMEDLQSLLNNYRNWRALHGRPEAFIGGVQSQNTIQHGWEINFKPQKSYGEFEEMIHWFKRVMGSSSELFQAPGHHRLVFPNPNLSAEAMRAFREGLAETYKIAQAYVVLRGIQGKTGINIGQWKFIMPDHYTNTLNRRANEIFRLEQNYIAPGTLSLEMRAGTKDAAVQRFVQQVVTSRVATQDFSGLENSRSWELIPRRHVVGGYPSYDANPVFPERLVYDARAIAETYELPVQTVQRAFDNLKSVNRAPSFGEVKRVFILPEFWVPFWNWQNAPFLSDEKKSLLKVLTRSFIESTAALEEVNLQHVQTMFSDWVRISKLTEDMENYLRPRPRQVDPQASPQFYRSLRPARAGVQTVNVNQIDLGLEYSARFPLKNRLLMADSPLEDQRWHWLANVFDLTNEEREEAILRVARVLSDELGGDSSTVALNNNALNHGHGLGIAAELTDSQNRTWRVEWDGIGRSYHANGELIAHSARGGHLEIVTPKFNPTFDEINAVYRAFDKTNSLPQYSMGGAHLNIDLAPFEGRPRELARFLAIFHEYRDIIALMYQHPKRLLAAEPLEISANLARQLADFNGSEDQLKQLLYNERYFNTRVGRKTRYIQLDLSAYFQDIIPEQFLHRDFDIGNPNTSWRRQFRVDPNIRKMEFRLFGAPESAQEAALHMQLVRAMLDKALNDETPLSGRVATMSYQKFLDNPQLALNRLKQMTNSLGLNFEDFRPHLARGLDASESYFHSQFFRSFEQRVQFLTPIADWGRALETPRASNAGIKSQDRVWSGQDVLAEAQEYQQRRVQAAAQADLLRSNPRLTRARAVVHRTDQSCMELMNFLLNPSR